MAQILLIGTATLDIVYTLDEYPAEDAEVRAQGLRVCRGGNAANSAVVLAQLGHQCNFAGVLAAAPETGVIEDDFLRHGIDFSSCPKLPGRPPTSSIQLTRSSRTIVHYRDLPELSVEQFARIDLGPFDWIHFEGRNVPELLKMLTHVQMLRPGLSISLELEKPRAGIEAAIEFASLLICSRNFALTCGYVEPNEFLHYLRGKSPFANIVVAWGEDGAYGLSRDGAFIHSEAFPPNFVVDTLGAGDAFNAGLIGAMANGMAFPLAVEAGSRVAGRKCGISGFELDLDEFLDMPNK